MFRFPRSVHHAAALAAAFTLVAGTAWAKDSTKSTFTNPDATSAGPFDDCASSGQHQSTGDKIQYKLKKLVGVPDTDQIPCSGDEVICVATATVNLGLVMDTAVATFGEVKKGQVQIKHQLCKENPAICGTPADVPSYATDIRCYASDGGAYKTLTEGGLFPLVISGCDRIGFAVSPFAFPLPASALIARGGMTNCYVP